MKTLQQHPFLHLLLPLMCGIICGEYSNTMLSSFSQQSFLTLLFFLFVCLLVAYKYFSSLFTILTYSFFFVLGTYLMNLNHSSLAFPFVEEKRVYQATVYEHPKEKERSLLCESVIRNRKFLLYFPKDSASYTIKRGDKLMLYAKLTPLRNNGNPYEFDYRRYSHRKGIVGSAYVPTDCWLKKEADVTLDWRQKAEDYRQKLIAIYTHLGLQGDALAVLVALTLGDKNLINDELRETYSVAGVSHVLALSGLHIGLLTWLLLLFWKPVLHYFPILKPLSVCLTVFLLFLYAFFTGLSPSVVRSVLMFSLLAFASLRSPERLNLNLLAVTAFLMLLLHPVWLFDVGFQLSFMAVAGIIIFYAPLYSLINPTNKLLHYLWSGVCVTISAQIATAPLVIFYFSSFPIYFLLANFWILIWIAVVIYLALFMLLFSPIPVLQSLLAQVVNEMLNFQHSALSLIGRLPGASLTNLWMDKVDILFYYLIVALILLCIYRPMLRLLYTCLLVALCAVGYHSLMSQKQAPSTSVVFYNLYSAPSIHLLSDNATSWLFTADSYANKERFPRSLQRYWNSMQLDEPQYLSLQSDTLLPMLSFKNRIITYCGHRICILDNDYWQGRYADARLSIDVLYVSKGYNETLHEVIPLFDVKQVVLDSSLPDYLCKRWMAECREHSISCVSLQDSGYFSVEFIH